MIMKSFANGADAAYKALSQIKCGEITVTGPTGEIRVFKGEQPGPVARMAIHDWSVIKHAMLKGDIGLGEDYVAGLWDTDDLESLFLLFLKNMEAFEDTYAHGTWYNRLAYAIYDRILRRNSHKGSRENIRAHYDVGNAFYKLWLDKTMTYSSAIFKSPQDALEQAQTNKYQRIIDNIAAPDKILEIGCGWGGFAEAATAAGSHVTGLTISQAQHDFATSRLAGKPAHILLKDYRDIDGLFDAIVSIEMFEAVGEKYWPDYFRTIASRLKKGGRAMVQTITIRDDLFSGYRRRSDFIRRHVFPGGMLPSKAVFANHAEKQGLKCVDMFSFGHDYAETLRRWQQAFEAQLGVIRSMGYSEAFIRNWRFYLSLCAAAFAAGRIDVVQVGMEHR